MGRNGSKIALRRNFYVAFRTFVGTLDASLLEPSSGYCPLGSGGEWLVWCRKETTRHGPGPARDRTAGWQPRSLPFLNAARRRLEKNAPKPDRAALWRATDQLFRTGW
jgi:hypothetical protein